MMRMGEPSDVDCIVLTRHSSKTFLCLPHVMLRWSLPSRHCSHPNLTDEEVKSSQGTVIRMVQLGTGGEGM